jgi:hypothetical protein
MDFLRGKGFIGRVSDRKAERPPAGPSGPRIAKRADARAGA